MIHSHLPCEPPQTLPLGKFSATRGPSFPCYSSRTFIALLHRVLPMSWVLSRSRRSSPEYPSKMLRSCPPPSPSPLRLNFSHSCRPPGFHPLHAFPSVLHVQFYSFPEIFAHTESGHMISAFRHCRAVVASQVGFAALLAMRSALAAKILILVDHSQLHVQVTSDPRPPTGASLELLKPRRTCS